MMGSYVGESYTCSLKAWDLDRSKLYGRIDSSRRWVCGARLTYSWVTRYKCRRLRDRGFGRLAGRNRPAAGVLILGVGRRYRHRTEQLGWSRRHNRPNHPDPDVPAWSPSHERERLVMRHTHTLARTRILSPYIHDTGPLCSPDTPGSLNNPAAYLPAGTQ